jgi:hexosaminidase
MALSEVAWSPLANKNFKDFSETRLPGHLAWLDKNNINYRVPTAIGAKDTVMIGSQLNVTLKPSVEGAKIYYTIDGYTPRETDLTYTIPLSLTIPQDQYRELQTIVITPSGKRSVVTRTVVYNKAPFAPVNYTGSATGLKYQLFTGTFTATNQLSNQAATDSGIVKTFNTADYRKSKGKFGVVYSGYINIDADGNYGFSTLSGNGSVLLIDDQPVVDNDGKHAVTEQEGAVPLQKGYHRFTLKYVDAGGPAVFKVFINAPGKQKAELTADTLYN